MQQILTILVCNQLLTSSTPVIFRPTPSATLHQKVIHTEPCNFFYYFASGSQPSSRTEICMHSMQLPVQCKSPGFPFESSAVPIKQGFAGLAFVWAAGGRSRRALARGWRIVAVSWSRGSVIGVCTQYPQQQQHSTCCCCCCS